MNLDCVRSATPEEVDFYWEHGWVYLPNVIDSDVAKTVLEDAKAYAASPPDGATYHRRPANVSAALSTIPDPEAGTGTFAVLSRSPSMASLQAQFMLASGPVRFFRNALHCKEPDTAGYGPTKWHQDFVLVPLDRSDRPNVWIALIDIPPERGALRFVDRSHHLGLLGSPFEDSEEDVLPNLYPQLFTPENISPPLHLKPGDATVHHALTIHSAPSNTTSTSRWGFAVQYVPADTRYTGGPSPRREAELAAIGAYNIIDHPAFPIIPTATVG
jgi:Phytanoyl-CoA dioxygenase (PhyH)